MQSRIKPIQELIDFLKQQEAIAASVDTFYTEESDPLFEKAYTHMIDILKQFPSPISELQPAVSATDEGSFTNPRQLFCTKKLYLMAMIAFLNSCHEAVASEHKSEIPTDISQIIYQEDLKTPQAPSLSFSADVKPKLGIRSGDPEKYKMYASASNNPAAKTASKKSIPELLQLISVTDEEALLTLSEEQFTSLLKKVSSCRDRTQLIHTRSDHKFKSKKQQEEEEAKARRQELSVAWEEALKKAQFTGSEPAVHEITDGYDSEGNPIEYHIWRGPMKLISKNPGALKECLDQFPDMQTQAHVIDLSENDETK